MITPEVNIGAHPTLDYAEPKIVSSMYTLRTPAEIEYRGRFVEVDGKRIHYLDYGDGLRVLLMHGGGAGSAIWFRWIEVLSKTDRVIAPDHPVFGFSE
ncbi:MAG: hypothetical protein OSB68_01540 [Dehalococcoidia bacterium]|nr:hypothetical protein [Dehalococcoidia bacterium]